MSVSSAAATKSDDLSFFSHVGWFVQLAMNLELFN